MELLCSVGISTAYLLSNESRTRESWSVITFKATILNEDESKEVEWIVAHYKMLILFMYDLFNYAEGRQYYI
jgi:hypothetical protein